MKKSRLFLGAVAYVAAVGLCGAILNSGRAAADPLVKAISNTNLTGVNAARTFLKNNNPGYLTYINGTKILYKENAGTTWKEITDSTDIAEANRGTTENEQNGCVDILEDDIYTFRVRFRSNYSGYDGGNCGNENANTNAELVYSGGRVNIDPPNGVPMAIFIRDIDSSNEDWQRIYLTKSALTFVYTPSSGAKFEYSNTTAYGRMSTKGNGLCNIETDPKCNALVLLSADSFYAKVMMKSPQGLMDIRNDMALPYRTLTLNPNGGSVADTQVQADGTVGDESTLWSHTSGANVLREYERNVTANEYPTPTRSGYTFLGWYDAASGGTLVSSRTMGSDATLYAHWILDSPSNVLLCGTNTFGGAVAIGEVYGFTITPTGTVNVATSVTATVNGPAGVALANNTVAADATGKAGFSFTPTVPGTYNLTWSASDGAGASVSGCADSMSAGDQPYFKVYGGDILAGISLAGGVPSSASIISWNQNTGTYSGAGSQLAALASGAISHFISNSDLIIGAGDPSALAFANTNANVSGNKYGGDFGYMPVVQSYIDTATSRAGVTVNTISSNDIDVNTLASGVYELASGNLTIHGNLAADKNVTIIVRTGSVYISAPITYGSYDLNTVPQLNVYTTGNIVVGRDVSVIHGIFVAEGGTNSKFYSCGTSALNVIGYSELTVSPALVSQCDNTPLTVYGSVVAHEVILSRTSGSWLNGGAPAEVFRHSPEAWLARPFRGTGSGDTFDNYISLPPVL